jgi:hypothetical protein
MTKKIPVLEDYKDMDGKDQTASVILTIDYGTKKYRIESNDRDGAFRFNKDNMNPPLWAALASLIQKAVYFAEEELKETA